MTSSVKPNRDMRRAQLKKSHSWWWDSHVSPKNSRWLAENLEEMDQSVKRMLKLIEEDGDSFAKKAEMYYQKRPELIAHVEEFYRIYRSLAERYDHVTGELRKNIPLDLQSQGSSISDVGSEQPSMLPPSDQRLSRRKSGPRAAGFEVFLGIGGSSSDLCDKGDETSTLDSESESDDSSVNNYSGQSANGDDQVLRRKVVESDVDLHDVKEKLRIQLEENGALLARVAGYEEELRTAKENIHLAHEQIAMLRTLQGEIDKTQKQGTEVQEVKEGSETGVTDPEKKMRMLEEELRVSKVKLSDSEREVAGLKQHLNDQLGSAKKDTSGWKVKLDKEKREVSKLQDRIARYKANLAEREQEIRALKETVSNANKSLSEENVQLQTEMTKLVKERAYLEDNLKEWDLRCQSVEEELRRAKAGKAEMEALFTNEIEKLKGDVVARDDRVEELNKSVDLFTLKYNTLLKETDELNIKVANLTGGVNSKDDQIVQMSKHLHELHIEHVELIGESERVRKLTEEMRTRVDELEKEVERQKEVIMEGAEEKREAIRQLCFSIEHYRDGYKQLRQAFVGHRHLPVMAS